MSVRHMIKQRRHKLELSLREVGEKTGLSTSYICDLEKGRVSPSLSSYIKLCRALDVKDLGYYLKDELKEED